MSFSWKSLPRPFFALAPMEGATDSAFRQVVVSCGRSFDGAQDHGPDVCFTEFMNVEGYVSEGKAHVDHRLIYDPVEQPLIVQLWGLDPENYRITAKEMVERGFAGIDINMACPVHAVVRKGCGGAMIKYPSLAAEIIVAVKEGAGGRVPVSVKTRIGYNKIATEEWIGFLLSQHLDALTVHGRTVKEMSKVPVHWDELAKINALREAICPETVLIGNGDVLSLEDAKAKARECNLDGIMIGRGVFYNPWLFGDQKERSKEERLRLLLTHMDLYRKLFGEVKLFVPMRRFFKIYAQNFPGAVELRVKLMECESYDEAKELVDEAIISDNRRV